MSASGGARERGGVAWRQGKGREAALGGGRGGPAGAIAEAARDIRRETSGLVARGEATTGRGRRGERARAGGSAAWRGGGGAAVPEENVTQEKKHLKEIKHEMKHAIKHQRRTKQKHTKK